MPRGQRKVVFQSGREITGQELDDIQETVGLFPSLSRTELAATISEHLGWVTLTGGSKINACMKLLENGECQDNCHLNRKLNCLLKAVSLILRNLLFRVQPDQTYGLPIPCFS